jgi:hypothetical protein
MENAVAVDWLANLSPIDRDRRPIHHRQQITGVLVAIMPAVTVKNLPDDLYERLKANAQAHHRSINGELIATLVLALTVQPQDPDG